MVAFCSALFRVKRPQETLPFDVGRDGVGASDEHVGTVPLKQEMPCNEAS